MIRVLVIGAASLSLALLAGCMSALRLAEHTVTVSGCPVVTPCSLLPAAPQNNGQLSDDSDYLLSSVRELKGQPDRLMVFAVAIPLLAWVLVNQRELIENLERNKDAITFEADMLDSNKVDLPIKLPLTERVIVKK